MGLIIRASSLAADCPKRWAVGHPVLRARIEELVGPLRRLRPHIGGIVGGGAHAGFAHLNAALRDTGEVGGRGRRRMAEEDAVHEVDVRIEKAGGKDVILTDKITPDNDKARAQVMRLTDQWHEHQRPTDAPVLIEERLAGQVAGTKVTGTVDLWVLSGSLIDPKSGKRPPKPEVHGPQQGVYSMLIRSIGKTVRRAALLWMPRTKKETPIEVVPIDVAAAERAAYAKVRFLTGMAEEFQRAVAGDLGKWWRDHPTDVLPENPQSHLCSEAFCPAWGTPICNSWKLKAHHQQRD